MMRNLTSCAFAFLLHAILLSCDKKATEPREEFGVEDFPNNVGFQWIYEVYDCLVGKTDTVTVTIADSLTLAGEVPATMWIYTYSDTVDTQCVAVINDTVKIYPGRDTFYLSVMFIFPLEIGNGWRYNSSLMWFDTCSVIEKDSISVPAGIFKTGFQIAGRRVNPLPPPDGFRYFTIWLVPDVGIVWMHIIVEGFLAPTIDETWQLLSYDLTP